MTQQEITDTCIAFIRRIGIEVNESEVSGESFVPGIQVNKGKLIVDRNLLAYPGDLLHEAGHIAVTPRDERSQLMGDATGGMELKKGDEMAVLIWSFLAAQEIGIPAEIVFHPDGYKGESEWLLENFRNGEYIGFPLLEWMGIARRKTNGEPEVIAWLRQ